MTTQCTDRFDWTIYRDATIAGLSALLPLPYIDESIEGRFRNQMVRAIARERGVELDEAVIDRVNREKTGWSAYVRSLLLKPLLLPVRWLTKTWSKMFYVLTVRRAVNTLAHYWRRAYLLDYMICMGYLDTLDSAEIAVPAMTAILKSERTDTLRSLALDAIRTIPDIPQAVKNGLQALRRNETDSLGERIRGFMDSNWGLFSDYFDELMARYEEERTRREADAKSRLTLPDAVTQTQGA